MADLTIKQGDTFPALAQTIIDPTTGSAANLAGASVTFTMRDLSSTTASLNAVAAAITNPATGAVAYSWGATDTATAGQYAGSFRVTTASGGTYTWPTAGYLDIVIEPSLASEAQTIVGLTELKRFLRFPDADRTHDDALQLYLAASVPVIENIVGAVIVKPFEEWYDGGTDAIQLRQFPPVALMAVSEYRGPVEYPLALVGNPAFGSVYSAMLDPEGRLVRRAPGGATIQFLNGKDNVHVVYTAGRQTIPPNIRLANLELVRDNYQPVFQGQHPAYTGGVDQGEEIGALRPSFTVSWRVREYLVPDRRHPSVA